MRLQGVVSDDTDLTSYNQLIGRIAAMSERGCDIYLYIDAKVKQAKTEKAHALSIKKMEKKVLGLETQLMNFFACPNVGCPLRRTRTLGSANTSTDEGE